MPELYPLLMTPQFHPRVWGSRSLAPIYSRQFDEPIGEAWLTGDDCQVANGALAGQTLGDLCRRFGTALTGEAAPLKDRFPLLIKFLFPREKLSVQVHPDDAMARRLGQPCGKTECWYVLAAEPGAQVGVGLKPGVTKEQFARAIKNGSAEKMLNWIDIQPGELIYVEAGTVHAIGPGSILVETQQNSDITFRLYDYGRPRELHLEQGLEAMTAKAKHSGKVASRTAKVEANLINGDCFTVDRFEVSEKRAFHMPRRSCEIFVALEGCGVVQAGSGPEVTFARGEAMVVPAVVVEFSVRPQWSLQCLRMSLPEGG